MNHALRHLLSIVLLPFLVVAAVPFWLLTSWVDIDTRWEGVYILQWVLRAAGIAVFLCGLALFSWCVALFAREGRGTLAPWDPTQELVTLGPYRYVRNPMISAVALMLVGQALFWGSYLLGAWTVLFVAINHIYFVLSEEPGLERRFGDAYRQYKDIVPRWIPGPRRKHERRDFGRRRND